MRVTQRRLLLTVMLLLAVFVSVLASAQTTPTQKASANAPKANAPKQSAASNPAASKPATASQPRAKNTEASKPLKKPARPTADYWFQAAEKFTYDALEEDWRLAPMEKALLQARLARLWWEVDRDRAHAWLANAADTVSQKLNDGTEADLIMRMNSARAILTLALPLDAALGQQVQDAVDAASKDATGATGRDALARSLAQASMDAPDPERARQLISQSLQAGVTFQAIAAVVNLGLRDEARGQQALAETLASLQQSHDFFLANDLLRVMFETSSMPASMQQATVDGIRLLAAQAGTKRCSFLETARRSSNMPEALAAALRSSLGDCEALMTPPPSPNRPPTTTDDYLRMAQSSPDPMVRFSYKTTAATLETNYLRALDIFDGLTDEEIGVRGAMSVTFMRFETARRGAVAMIEAKPPDQQTARQIVQHNPEGMRASIGLIATMDGREKRINVADLERDALDDVRRLRTDDPQDYIKAINLSLPGKDDYAYFRLSEMMQLLSRWEPLPDPKALKAGQRYSYPLENMLSPLQFRSEVADLDLEKVATFAKTLKKTKLRASYDLGVLQHVTKRYVEEKSSESKLKKVAAGQ